MLGAFGLGQLEARAVEWRAGRRVVRDALGVVTANQAAVPGPLRIERDVGSDVALAEARIPQQLCAWLLLQQLDQTPAQRQRAAFATVRAAAHHNVHVCSVTKGLLM